MIKELWRAFPRLLEQNINGLLSDAVPNATKAFQLYKACQYEGLWTQGFEKFSKHLETFFSRPKSERRKSHFDIFLDRPMDQAMFVGFHINFRTGVVSEESISKVASWAHQLMRASRKTTSAAISLDVMTQTLQKITNPLPFEKAENIEFEDFCSAWQKTVFKLFGKKHDVELGQILKELHAINAELKLAENDVREISSFPTIYLTQTELDWTLAVREAAFERTRTPKFPLSRGPQKQLLMDLDRAVSLYMIVQNTRLPELLAHRENIRATILDRCDRLLGRKAS